MIWIDFNLVVGLRVVEIRRIFEMKKVSFATDVWNSRL
jgi:hypothetical protein